MIKSMFIFDMSVRCPRNNFEFLSWNKSTFHNKYVYKCELILPMVIGGERKGAVSFINKQL